jgi:hypothetical protein
MTINRFMPLNYWMLPLAALMAFTRVHHFGDAFSLPDASLAVFFLAGMYCNSRWLLGLLLVEAGLIDYVAVSQFDVSDWCISSAYVFLIPTYAALWFAGRYSATFNTLKGIELAKTLALLIIATTAAFAISNGSFYFFSGRYTDMALIDYVVAIVQYYLPYLTSAVIYTVLGLVTLKVAKLLLTTETSRTTI